KVESEDEMIPAWQKAQQCGGTVIAERWIEGDEYTATILNGNILPLIKLKTPNQFYDYEAKYQSETTEYICPCGLLEEKENEIASIAVKAFDAICGKGWGRVDFMLDKKMQPWLIEANTVPGMTDHSLVPMAAKQAGYAFHELVVEILKTSLDENA
ncbi:MAG: D-alanine--D-alanine ligase, partial [Gammaproteobacteria bacterium]|nr:D-alanine--D-alanine ligase [Gammaproteobacteria bacterium]